MDSFNGDPAYGSGISITGEPKERVDRFPIPQVLTFQAMLGISWKSYWMGRHDEALRQDPGFARAMRHDLFNMGLMQERALGVASLKWHLEVDNERDPTEKLVKDHMTKVVRRTWRRQELVRNLLEAVWFGRYGAQLQCKFDFIDGRKSLVIAKHRAINGDKINHLWDGTPHVQIMPIADQYLPKGVEVMQTSAHFYNSGRAVVLRGEFRENFIIHRHLAMDEDFVDYERAACINGAGVRDVIHWFEWLKMEWLSNVTDWAERAGLGVRLWYYPLGNNAAKAKAEANAADNTRKVNIIVPYDPEQRSPHPAMEYQDVATGGPELLLKLIQYIDEAKQRYVIGQSLSSGTEGSGLGGTGVASMHANTKQKIVAYDAQNLAETLTCDQLDVSRKYTFPELPSDMPCRLVFDVDDPESEKKLNAVKVFTEMGGTVIANEARALTGLSDPQEGDDVIGGQQAMPGAGAPGVPGQPGADQPQQPGRPWKAPQIAQPDPNAVQQPEVAAARATGEVARYVTDDTGRKHDELGLFTGDGNAAAKGNEAKHEHRSNITLAGRKFAMSFRKDGKTHVEINGNHKVVTYTLDGIRHGYIEDAEGGNVRGFVIRRQAKESDQNDHALPVDDTDTIQQEAMEQAASDADRKKLERKKEFEKKVGHAVIHPQSVAGELSKSGIPTHKNTSREKRSGVSVRAIPGKHTWLAVEWRDAGGDDNDTRAKSEEVQKHLEERGYAVTRPFPDETILAVRKPIKDDEDESPVSRHAFDESSHPRGHEGNPGQFAASGSTAEASQPAQDASGEPTAQQPSKSKADAWQERQTARDQRIIDLDTLENDAGTVDKADLDALVKADAEIGDTGDPEQAAAAMKAYTDTIRAKWQDVADRLTQMGASERDARAFGRAATKLNAYLGKAEVAYTAAASKIGAAARALEEIEAQEPEGRDEQEEPDAWEEQAEPDEPDLPGDEPQQSEYERLGIGREEFERDHNDWMTATAAYPKLLAEYEQAVKEIGRINTEGQAAYDTAYANWEASEEKESDAWQDAHDRWEAKRDKAEEKHADLSSKFSELLDPLVEKMDEHEQACTDALYGFLESERDRVEQQDTADPEPDEDDEEPVTRHAFHESEHPRGHEGNPGQFAEKGGASFDTSSAKAPPGGIKIAGKNFKAGERIPTAIFKRADKDQQKAIKAASGGDKPKEKPAARPAEKPADKPADKPAAPAKASKGHPAVGTGIEGKPREEQLAALGKYSMSGSGTDASRAAAKEWLEHIEAVSVPDKDALANKVAASVAQQAKANQFQSPTVQGVVDGLKSDGLSTEQAHSVIVAGIRAGKLQPAPFTRALQDYTGGLENLLPIDGQLMGYLRPGANSARSHRRGDVFRYTFDESKVHRGQPGNAGQFGSGGGTATTDEPERQAVKADGKIAKTISKAKETVKRVKGQLDAITDVAVLKQAKAATAWLKDKAGELKAKLEARYGKKAALAILATGQTFGWGATAAGAAVGVPVWLPGSTIWGSLPAMAVAEVFLQASKLVRHEADEEADLSPEDTDAIAQWVFGELQAEYMAWLQEQGIGQDAPKKHAKEPEPDRPRRVVTTTVTEGLDMEGKPQKVVSTAIATDLVPPPLPPPPRIVGKVRTPVRDPVTGLIDHVVERYEYAEEVARGEPPATE